MSKHEVTKSERIDMLDWLIENEAFLLKRHDGKSCVFISGSPGASLRVGDFCDSPYEALRSAINQISQDKG